MVTVNVKRTPSTLTFEPFNLGKEVVLSCPERRLTGTLLSVKGSKLSWPAGGEVMFDYVTKRIIVHPAITSRPGIKRLQINCDGSIPKLDAGAGLNIVEKQ